MLAETLMDMSGSDSCRHAFDGVCDEPTYCAYGTDTTDCSGSVSSGYGAGGDSCEYAFDGACDEPTYCAYGTDTTDCSGSVSSGYGAGGDSCEYAFDGACDEPAYCAYGTDTTDCSSSVSSGYSAGGDSCDYAFDGMCDEPTYCAYGTDTTDCGGSSSAGIGQERDYGEESDDSYWTDVPDQYAAHDDDDAAEIAAAGEAINALDCIVVRDVVGALNKSSMTNICDRTVWVAWCEYPACYERPADWVFNSAEIMQPGEKWPLDWSGYGTLHAACFYEEPYFFTPTSQGLDSYICD